MTPTPAPRHDDVPGRRQRVRRTALWVAAIAVAVYVGFILLGVLSQ